MEREELAAWLRLALTDTVGNTAGRRLLAAFGLPQAIFSRSQAALAQVVSAGAASALTQEPPRLPELIESTWRWLNEGAAGARHVVTLGDAHYPPALLATEDPPLMFYAWGILPSQWPDALAIVGSRNPTPQGLENARNFARSLSQSGLTIVSGLALGVDGAAHQGALEGAAPGQLATIAVIGTGIDVVYPKRHQQLAAGIVERGLVVSEYPLGTPPLAPNFPKRNRIIAALGAGTLVVEAAVQSGSLITARQAAEQGREVFAIPGSIHSPQSRGCHALIKQGAKLVESAQDVLEELRPRAKAQSSRREEEVPHDAVLAALGFDPVGIDALVARTGMSAADLQARLLEHELDGSVARLPGGLYQRVGAG